MDDLKEKVLIAILNGEFSNEELNSFLNHEVSSVSEEQADRIIQKWRLLEAMKTIAFMPNDGGTLNDSAYDEVMEEIENMRNDWLNKAHGHKKSSQSIPAQHPPKKQPSEKQIGARRENAAKAREARAKKRSKEKEH